MTRQCDITGKLPLAGNSVSHAHNKNRRRFLPNLHKHRFWHPTRKQFVKLRVSAKAIRLIDRYGIEAVLDSIENKRKIKKNQPITTSQASTQGD